MPQGAVRLDADLTIEHTIGAEDVLPMAAGKPLAAALPPGPQSEWLLAQYRRIAASGADEQFLFRHILFDRTLDNRRTSGYKTADAAAREPTGGQGVSLKAIALVAVLVAIYAPCATFAFLDLRRRYRGRRAVRRLSRQIDEWGVHELEQPRGKPRLGIRSEDNEWKL